LRIAATCPSRPLRVGVKNVEWDRERCHTLYSDRAPFRKRIDPTEKHPIRSPIRSGPRDASLALPRTGSLARAGEGAQPLPLTAPRVAERRGQRATDPPLDAPLSRDLRRRDGPGRPFASVIAATPRALNPMFHQPRRTRASRKKSEDLPFFPKKESWLGIPRALALSRVRPSPEFLL